MQEKDLFWSTPNDKTAFHDRIMGEFDHLYGFSGSAKAERGRDIELELKLTLAEVVAGAPKKLRVRRDLRCPTCHGTRVDGSLSGLSPCYECRGTGRASPRGSEFFGLDETTKCPLCHGLRFVGVSPCKYSHVLIHVF